MGNETKDKNETGINPRTGNETEIVNETGMKPTPEGIRVRNETKDMNIVRMNPRIEDETKAYMNLRIIKEPRLE